MSINVQLDAKMIEHLIRTRNMYRDWALRGQPGLFLRVVTVNGKEFVVRKDEHGEFYEPLAGTPAKAAE